MKIEKKDKNIPHKKGIEHLADYQNEIRKAVDEEKPNYKEGYLIEEFNKAKKQILFRKKASAITPVFEERGPANVPGRSRGMAVDPTNPNRWYVGTVGGGVWLTQDAGTTWVNLTDLQIPNLATSTIVISPQDANTLYVGTGEPFRNLGAIGGSGVFKTTDGGTTWQHLTASQNFGDVGRIIINPNDKNNVLIATESGIYRTINGGGSWTVTYNSSGIVQDLDADPTDFNIQYGSVRNLGIVRSTDGGLTWSIVLDRASFNSNHSRFETSVSPADPNTVFVSVYSASGATVGVNTDFYVSRNKGASFTNLKTNGTADSANLLTGQGWYDNVIMAHPYDANVFYVGGVAVFKVTVSGSLFSSQPIASGYDNTQINRDVHVDQHGLFTVLGNNQEFRILLANDGGVFSTSFKEDPGVSQGDWSNSVLGKNSTQFYGAAKENGKDNYLAGAQDNGSWLSQGDDSSKSKSFLSVTGGDGFEAIWHYNNPGDIITTSQTNVIYRFINFSGAAANIPDSRDSGKSPFYTKVANADNNPDVVFTVSTSGVWRSTDFAANWTLVPITSNFTSSATSSLNIKVSPANPNIVWTGAVMEASGSYTMHVSQDNGQNFTKTNVFDDPRGAYFYNISGMSTSYIEKNRAYLAFSQEGAAKILKTEDLGNTWVDISGYSTRTNTGFPNVAVHSVLEMPFDKNIIWAGTDIGLFQTEDGGANWSLVSEFIPVAIYDMKIVNDQVVIATYGRGIWSATIAELNNYEPAAFLSLPDVTSKQKGFDSSQTLVSYNVTGDNVNRVKIFINDVEQPEVVQDFNKGVTYEYETANLSEGIHKFSIQLFDDRSGDSSSLKDYEFSVIDFENASQTMGIDQFAASDVYSPNGDFLINNMSGAVSELVMNNSDHPYQNNKTYTSILRRPLIITEANKNFTYEDMAITEPYSDDLNDLNSFYDFVIIEASSDLETWKTLDKYDSRRFTDWLDEYNKGTIASANDNLFKSQTIVLTDNGFSIGETIVFRFSLVADPFENSFGWAIKSIEGSVASIDKVINGMKLFSVYPTISKGNFTIFGKNTLGKSKIQIVDVNGKKVYQNTINFNKEEKQEISVNLNTGIYMVNLIDENNKKSSSKIIIE
ncbi:T9SS type A sorting domain-containing protein [Polaribacter sp. SA4-10]|uniref:T9SS type A sorting domain-containing protein n=1 Tax=Polaribacter sp. SA4-10 TaxID=754397 RepID=UPI001E3E6065|nr:T9SS type A sorting domain-containing protein [Polaribacter sp. SA4-10]